MDEDNAPQVPERSLLIHLLGRLDALETEVRLHRVAFEEHTRSVRRHRILGFLIGVMEWRATLIAGGAIAASYFKWWPWRK